MTLIAVDTPVMETPEVITVKPEIITPKRGIVIIALGHPYYGQYAGNLAMSIKATEPTMDITLLHDGNSTSYLGNYARFFNRKIIVPQEHKTASGIFAPLITKLKAIHLSPYEETIIIDADTIWLPKKMPSHLFDELDQHELWIQSRGALSLLDGRSWPTDSSYWLDLNILQERVPGAHYWNLSSEVMYFKKTEPVQQFFERAAAHYASLLTGGHWAFSRPFAGGVPDEAALSLALIDMPQLASWQHGHTVFFWFNAEQKYLEPFELHARYYGLSMGGSRQNKQVHAIYNSLAQYYANRVGLGAPVFHARDKATFLPERAKI